MRKYILLCSLLLTVGVYSSCESCLHDLKLDYDNLHTLWVDYQQHQNFTKDFLSFAKSLLETYNDCYLEHIY